MATKLHETNLITTPAGNVDEDDDSWNDDSDDGSWGDVSINSTEVIIPTTQVSERPRGGSRVWNCRVCRKDIPITNFDCPGCGARYNPVEDMVIETDQPDYHDLSQAQISLISVWKCPICTYNNLMEQTRCDSCGSIRPIKSNLEIWQIPSDNAPQKLEQVPPRYGVVNNGEVNFGEWVRNQENANNHNKGEPEPEPVMEQIRKPRNDLFIKPREVEHSVNPQLYPTTRDSNQKANGSQLVRAFGVPFVLQSIKNQNMWSKSGCIIHLCSFDLFQSLPLKENSNVVTHGIAVNEEGNLTIMTNTSLTVFAPHESNFKPIAHYFFEAGLFDLSRSIRVRYSEDIVYIFANYNIYRYQLTKDGLTQLPMFDDDYIREQKFVDIALTDSKIIGIWEKWCGTYHKENFSWYHAVAHTHSSARPHQIEVLDGYAHVYLASSITAFHLGSMEMHNLWCVANVQKNGAFCVSRHHGVFATQNGKNLVQSLYDAHRVHSIIDFDENENESKEQMIENEDENENENEKENGEYKKRMETNQFPIDKVIVQEGLDKMNLFKNISHLIYDESYGISGRLIIYDNHEQSCFALFSQQDFQPLFYVWNDYLTDQEKWIMPGAHDSVPFYWRKIMLIYEFLYGSDVIGWIINFNQNQIEGEQNA